MSKTFTEHTRRLVQNRPASLTLERISKESGINIRWLRRFNRAEDKKPDATLVERLYIYLTGWEAEYLPIHQKHYNNVD